MDTLSAILIGIALFVAFVLLTAYFMKSTLYMNMQSKVEEENSESEKDEDNVKNKNGN
jgi:uncharacterized membrane protein YciS (DUF1049 family)